jgi:PPOX class probable F420-dependent enzyme
MNVASSRVLSDRIRTFLDKPNYATLATVGADGTPHQAVIWYGLQPDDQILINSRTGRRWPADLLADRRCSLAVVDRNNAMLWVGLQGEVEEVIDDVERARNDIVKLSVRYGGHSSESEAMFRSQPRISFRLRITGVHDHLED